jgi:hypothetical protein
MKVMKKAKKVNATRKNKKEPTEWMKLVKKHINSGKKFGEALKAAKKEYRK